VSKSYTRTTKEIEENIQALCSYIRKAGLDGAYISSFDIFMNEYVPMEECVRYYFTGFSGSVADVLLTSSGECYLFVDGRYHEQADLEVKASNVKIEKCPFGVSLFSALCEKAIELNIDSLWLDGDRTPLGHYEEFKTIVSKTCIESTNHLREFIELPTFKKDATISKVGNLLSSKEKAALFLKKGEAFWLNSLDSIAWITNMRGYGLPFQSSFMGRCFITNESVELAIPSHYDCVVEDEFIKVTKCEIDSFSKDLKVDPSISKIYYDPALINLTDYLVLSEKFNKENLLERESGIIFIHAIKSASEMSYMDDSFARSDQAIVDTLKWLKKGFHEDQTITEMDFFNKTTECYENRGSLEHSFGTISAFGSNSSIMHYSTPSKDLLAEDGMLALLDSGGYFEGGFATDTTRTIYLGKSVASDKQKEIYTLVLKGLLQAQAAIFPEGTWGSYIDALARTPILQAGYNYAHGTGHGVGINVHEGGLRFSPTSSIPINIGNVGSIEPGIYLPGFGGVRLENIVSVVKHPTLVGMLCFRPLVYIGFDHSLINFSLLNEVEKNWLSEYEEECRHRGTLLD